LKYLQIHRKRAADAEGEPNAKAQQQACAWSISGVSWSSLVKEGRQVRRMLI
jgi:hypothetical protein